LETFGRRGWRDVPPPPDESTAVVESPARKKAAGFLEALCVRDGKDEASVKRGRRDASWRIMAAEDNFEVVRNFL
jgi:hypothetical protein